MMRLLALAATTLVARGPRAVMSQESGESPCPNEETACFADGACIGALPGDDGDMTACFANELCGAMMQCHMDANDEDPCPAEAGNCLGKRRLPARRVHRVRGTTVRWGATM